MLARQYISKSAADQLTGFELSLRGGLFLAMTQ